MSSVIETIVVKGDFITVPLLVWRRFRRPMPGLVEAIYSLNHELAESGPYIPVGTSIKIPVPIPREKARLEPIKLW